MCCRYHLHEKHYREVLARLGIAAPAAFASRYNIAPGGPIPAVRANARTGEREVAALRWGLTPAWAKSDDPAARLVNARAETLAEKPSFRDAARTRRCLVPASGFFEWESVGRAKRPWLFRRGDEAPFGFAGLWESWRAPDGTVVESCALITTEPNDVMRPIHHRMPAMLTPEAFELWLDARVTDGARLAPLLQPAPAVAMSALRVNPVVSNVHADGPECLQPAGEDAQLSLGLG